LDAASVPHEIGGTNRVRVEAGAGAGLAGARAPVAEMHRHAVVGMPDDREHRTANRASLVAELDDVADDLAVLAAGPRRLVLGLELLSGGGTDDDRVVPGQLGDRLRQFLQPAVVGEA